jgi:hypothetical protein
MVETSLIEIFSGDVPRIDTVSIFLDYGSRRVTPRRDLNKCGPGCYAVGDDLVILNYWNFQNWLKDYRDDGSVFLRRTPSGFRAVRGYLPASFRGPFPLKCRVTFKVEELPLDNDLVAKTVAEIKEYQAKLDAGSVIGMAKWAYTCGLWQRVGKLNGLVSGLDSEVRPAPSTAIHKGRGRYGIDPSC